MAEVEPLRKRTGEGEPYRRRDHVEVLIAEVAALPFDEFVRRASIKSRTDPGYLPGECVLHFLRATRADNNEGRFERLYRILLERVLGRLPVDADAGGRKVSLAKETIREKVLGRFVELLSVDRAGYCEKLDYYEISFDGALANLRRDVQAQAWRHERTHQPLGFDEDSGELAAEVEDAAGVHDPFNDPRIAEEDYRSRLEAAIDTLPPEQIRIIQMLKLNFPIDSQDPDAMTISRSLGRSEKTVRSHRDKAFAAIRAAMAEGDAP